jgi:hypothetical protein
MWGAGGGFRARLISGRRSERGVGVGAPRTGGEGQGEELGDEGAGSSELGLGQERNEVRREQGICVYILSVGQARAEGREEPQQADCKPIEVEARLCAHRHDPDRSHAIND